MKIKVQICLAIVISFALIQSIQGAQIIGAPDHDLWIAEILKEIGTIQPGKTRREDLEKIFRRSGGLSTPIIATFSHKDSMYIMVDIEFTPAVKGSRTEDPKDIVKNISKPYLGWPTRD
jgi:hypothetical protein